MHYSKKAFWKVLGKKRHFNNQNNTHYEQNYSKRKYLMKITYTLFIKI